MRNNKIGIALCIIFGSFCLYCTQSAVTMMGNGHDRDGGARDGASPIGNADAQSNGGGGTCCAPIPSFTKIAEGDLPDGTTPSPIVAVGGKYRELVVYTQGACATDVFFRADASAPFMELSVFPSGPGVQSGRILVNGSDVQLQTSNCTGTNARNVHYVIAGVNE